MRFSLKATIRAKSIMSINLVSFNAGTFRGQCDRRRPRRFAGRSDDGPAGAQRPSGAASPHPGRAELLRRPARLAMSSATAFDVQFRLSGPATLGHTVILQTIGDVDSGLLSA